jgi:protein-disulfide isomerase
MAQTATRSTPRRFIVLAALALLGLGVSIYLTQHYYEVRNGSAGFHALCNLGASMNCDAVAASSYADLLPGFPLSSFSAGWFLAMFVIALIARNPFWRRESLRLALALSSVGVVFSVIYFGIMAGVLHTYCLFCLVTDALTLLTFGLVVSLKPEGFSQHKPEAAKWKTLGGVSAAALLVAVLGLRVLDESSLTSSDISQKARAVLDTPVLSVASGPEFPSFGAAVGAPVTVVEFSDFQCPFCRLGSFIVNSVIQKYPTQVRVVFRNFPLDNGCNRKMDHPMHAYACEAAKTVICANKQGKFEPVYQTFFENQTSFAPGRLQQLAQEAGADATRLNTCIADPDTSAAISRDVEEAANLNIESTPTFYINGHKMAGAEPPAVWSAIIDELVKQQSH